MRINSNIMMRIDSADKFVGKGGEITEKKCDYCGCTSHISKWNLQMDFDRKWTAKCPKCNKWNKLV